MVWRDEVGPVGVVSLCVGVWTVHYAVVKVQPMRMTMRLGRIVIAVSVTLYCKREE